MSLLDVLLEKGKEAASDPSWVEKAVAAGKKNTDNLGELKPVADAALDTMLAHKDKLASVGGTTFVSIMNALALGKIDDAKLLYLRRTASFDELMNALDQASEATRKERAARDEAWESVKAVGLEILKKAGAAAIPLLLAAI